MARPSRNILILAAVAAAVLAGGAYAWTKLRHRGPGDGFASGNGRLEATEIDVAAKLGGRVQDILVEEGDTVRAGQVLAHMQVRTLDAQSDEARARQQQAVMAVGSAEAQVAVRSSDLDAAQAVAVQRASDLEAARLRLGRSETLAKEGASSDQELDDDRARVRSARAALGVAQAQVAAGGAGVLAARTQVLGARSAVTALGATVARIRADIDDSALVAPRDGRVQFRIVQPGEVLGAGGKVLNLVDLSDVHMTFFLPEAAAGRLAQGSEVHLLLDGVPGQVIPARISFVASTAQFTPKTVETASERQKLMFRVKAQLGPGWARQKMIKTGLPGVVWVKLDDKAPWPPALAVR